MTQYPISKRYSLLLTHSYSLTHSLLLTLTHSFIQVTLGTPINLKFRKEISAALNVPDYATNRGASATIDWSNIYWASRLAIAGYVLTHSFTYLLTY